MRASAIVYPSAVILLLCLLFQGANGAKDFKWVPQGRWGKRSFDMSPRAGLMLSTAITTAITTATTISNAI